MISKPLFRVGDFVTIRDDIVSDTNVYYSMLQPDARNIFVSGCYTLFGNRYRIQSACGQYNCEGSPLGLTDEMFQEGKRIMQYLNYTDEPANELGVGYLDYELLDTLCGEAGAPYDASDWSVTTAPYITYSPWRDTVGCWDYSVNINATEVF